MSHWLRGTLILVATVVAVAVAVAMAFLPIGGHNNSRSLAQNEPKLELDMVQDAGGSWCNPVDHAATHTQGQTYQVAICMTNSPVAVAGFNFNLLYNTSLNQCNPVTCTDSDCFDTNPDANLGTTTFNGSLPLSLTDSLAQVGAAGINASATTLPVTDTAPLAATKTIKIDSEQMTVTARSGVGPGPGTVTVVRGVNGTTAAAHAAGASIFFTIAGLGQGWTCNLGGVAPPDCGTATGIAFLQCNTVTGSLQLPFGTGTSEPIAVLSFTALAGGVDTLTLDTVSVIDVDTNEILACPPATSCSPATDTKLGTPTPATATPTNTPVPPTATPTNTPLPPTATPTNTPSAATATSTNTPVPATATSTNTPQPPTATPTNTPIEPTATPTNTPLPPTATSTNTPVPPTATPTNTPIPPTATNTPLPPTATPTSTPVTPTATFTPRPPTATPTNTATPAATNTPSPQGCVDLNGDGKTSGRDVSIVARALFTEAGNRRFNPVSDVNKDGRVNLTDLFMVIKSLTNPACRSMVH